MGDWENLPVEILFLFAQRLDFMEDFISFCAVCKSWKSILSEWSATKPSLPPRLPLVMLPEPSGSHKHNEYLYPHWRRLYSLQKSETCENDNSTDEYELPEVTCIKCYKDREGIQVRRFYSLSTSKTYEFELPELNQRKCIGADYGWLVTFGYDLKINLIHPFSKQKISLPSMLAFKDQYKYDESYMPQHVVDMYVTKVVMSRNPRDDKFMENQKDKCAVLAIYGEFKILAFARMGEKVWININVSDNKAFEDIIYYNCKYYAVNHRGALFLCKIEDKEEPKATKIVDPPCGPIAWDLDNKYLVESKGELLLVYRTRDHFAVKGYDNWRSSRTLGFKVFKLEECHIQGEKRYTWNKVENLDGRALFLGNNVSKSLPSSTSVKANCIYFSEDDPAPYYEEPDGGGRDTGIFDLENGTLESHYVAKFCCPLSPPMWYV